VEKLVNNTALKSFVDELIKISNTNVGGKTNKNINSTIKPAKVPISKGAPSVSVKNAVPKVKVTKPNMPKYSFRQFFNFKPKTKLQPKEVK
jgi:hypothetical protein